jgi:hypothetical protein
MGCRQPHTAIFGTDTGILVHILLAVYQIA